MELIFLLFLIAAGLFAGFMSGLLGVRGGFVFAPAMYFVLQHSEIPDETAILFAFGPSLAVAFPTILTSVIGHVKKHNVSVKKCRCHGIL